MAYLLLDLIILIIKIADVKILIVDDNNLNLKEDLTYQEYEKVVTKFYYETYPDQIFNYYHEYDERISSLTHAYNVFVLNLPVEPTVEYYQTEYFKYQQLSDGSFDVNAKAIQIRVQSFRKA